ncbi:MAG: hypothetical protein QM765_50525 [Myxococcales bacterium]
MLQLLPPVCRDCGKTAKEAKLSPYLDFHLCGACIARREREVLADPRAKRKAPSKKSKREAEVEAPKKPKAKVAKKPGGGRGRRP